VFIAEQKAVVQQHLRSAEVSQKTYVRSVKEDFDQKLRDKQAELDRVIQQARKRRLKLQAELDEALEQIRALQGSWAGDDDIESRIQDSIQYDFESSKRQLDETMSQLGLQKRPK
jgi:outer membrane protein TolC